MPDDDSLLGQNEVDVRNEGRRAAQGQGTVVQLALADVVAPVGDIPAHRVVALAGVLAGFRWPGRTSFEKLKLAQQRAALAAARTALEALAREPD